MKMMLALSAAALAMAATAAQAAPRSISGVFNGTPWTASNMIVGQTGTGTAVAVPPGDPIYNPTFPAYSGVVTLIMDYSFGSFICSGSLLPDRVRILTAAHCVTDGPTLERPNRVTAYFHSQISPDEVPFFTGASVKVGKIFVHPDYTGDVIDDSDLAVLQLSALAPASAVSYELASIADLTGLDFNVAGYGGRSLTGGDVGANLGTGRLRQGDNNFIARLGDPDFTGGWEVIFGVPTAQLDQSWISDFDRTGVAANDAMCIVAANPFFGLGGPKYCNTGVGPKEATVAGGDSGGPQFIGGKIVSVTSYGFTFGSSFGDVDDFLNSSWGEFAGFVPVFPYLDWIASAVPAPSAVALFGLGLAGLGVARRRRA
jgi:V8-like Glu-specific endopeptidase